MEKALRKIFKQEKECNVVTCMHCVLNTCHLEECEFFERKLKQEY